MAKGTTVSVTLPTKLLEYYDNQAKVLNTSRSNVIRSILINEYTGKNTVSVSHCDCDFLNREDFTCKKYEMPCNDEIQDQCSSYQKIEV